MPRKGSTSDALHLTTITIMVFGEKGHSLFRGLASPQVKSQIQLLGWVQITMKQ